MRLGAPWACRPRCSATYLKVSRRLHNPLSCHRAPNQGQEVDAYWRSPLPASHDKPAIVALGKFDALHVGHRSLAAAAAAMGGTPYLISFSGMAEVLNWPARAPIVADCQRQSVLEGWIRFCNEQQPQYRALPFSSVRSMQPQEFVCLLAEDLKASGIVVGQGYRFGYKQSGDAELLRSLGEGMGMSVKIIDLVGAKIPGIVGHASSSEVRKALSLGKLKRVQHFLGRPYMVTAFLDHTHIQVDDSILRIPCHAFLNQLPKAGRYEGFWTAGSDKQGQEHTAIDITSEWVEIQHALSGSVHQPFVGPSSNVRIDLIFST